MQFEININECLKFFQLKVVVSPTIKRRQLVVYPGPSQRGLSRVCVVLYLPTKVRRGRRGRRVKFE